MKVPFLLLPSKTTSLEPLKDTHIHTVMVFSLHAVLAGVVGALSHLLSGLSNGLGILHPAKVEGGGHDTHEGKLPRKKKERERKQKRRRGGKRRRGEHDTALHGMI